MSNFFFSPPAHLCAVTYMTEISLIVTLNKPIHSLTHFFLTNTHLSYCKFCLQLRYFACDTLGMLRKIFSLVYVNFVENCP